MKDTKLNLCKNCKGTGMSLRFKNVICSSCEGTGVKLSDETTEISSLVGGELYEDDPNFLDFEEDDYELED